MPKIAEIIASFFGLGYLKPLPGTISSLVIFLIIYFLNPTWNLNLTIVFLIILSLIAYLSIKQILVHSNDNDPSWVVIDEVLASVMILAITPRTIIGYFIAFIIFRLFDGQKIWPINLLDKIKTPLGVIIDDLAAGIIALVITRLILIFCF